MLDNWSHHLSSRNNIGVLYFSSNTHSYHIRVFDYIANSTDVRILGNNSSWHRTRSPRSESRPSWSPRSHSSSITHGNDSLCAAVADKMAIIVVHNSVGPADWIVVHGTTALFNGFESITVSEIVVIVTVTGLHIFAFTTFTESHAIVLVGLVSLAHGLVFLGTERLAPLFYLLAPSTLVVGDSGTLGRQGVQIGLIVIPADRLVFTDLGIFFIVLLISLFFIFAAKNLDEKVLFVLFFLGRVISGTLSFFEVVFIITFPIAGILVGSSVGAAFIGNSLEPTEAASELKSFRH